ncbi:MAG: LPS biosynthesis protein WbpP [Anaerolineaceae bacterium]|nr:LPS biosynthesis protein WbpP [Anaerolineaceae bacterium]
MSETYIVTGGAGFIGSHIAANLLTQGHSVRVVDNLLTGKSSNLDYLRSPDGDLTIHELSILDTTAITDVFKGADAVFHQAALPSVPRSIADPLEANAHCVTGTVSVLKAAVDAEVRRVVYAASSAAYGDRQPTNQTETMLPAPLSPYGAAKLAGEIYCQAFHESYGLETVCLRYFNVFGPRQDPNSEYAAVIPKFITRMLEGQAPIIFGDGEQTRDFIHVNNVVQGNWLAAHAPDAVGEVINLATGTSISLLTLVEELNAILGTDMQPIHKPARVGDIVHSGANINKARELLDFAPRTSFSEGLQQTVAAYQQTTA